MTIQSMQKQIHVACRDLGIDNDTRRVMQENICGKTSMKDMDAAELYLVIDHLKKQGWKSGYTNPKAPQKRKAAPRADLRYIHVLWAKLAQAQALRDTSRAGLNSFIRKRFGKTWKSVPIDVDSLRDHQQISQVINALKDWCKRIGVKTTR